MKHRSIAREKAFLYLYQEGLEEDNDIIEDELNNENVDVKYFQKLISEINSSRSQIIEKINQVSSKYNFKGQNRVDLTVVMIALIELDTFKEKPGIVINEAIELAKKYSTIEGKNFIHSYLDQYLKNRS